MIHDSSEIYISNDQNFLNLSSDMKSLIKLCCNTVLDEEKFNGCAEISITFLDNNQIREINRTYREKDVETDVLSFPMSQNNIYDINLENGCYVLGDIMISCEKALAQSIEYNHSIEREIGFLVVHSMLHLLGYDHEISEFESSRMREKEEKLLSKIGLFR